MDLLKPTPTNLIISPVYKNVFPANIWNKKDHWQQTQCVEVQDVNPRPRHQMTRQDYCAVVAVVIFALCLFAYGFYKLEHDD